MGDWSLLPADILVGIALKLDSIDEVMCLSAVCHSWNDVFNSTVKPAWSRANKPALPWLLLAEPEPEPEPEPSNKDKSNIRRVLSISKNKCYDMMLPEITGKRCWGSSCGWIVMLEFNKNVTLFNPITKAQLSLPSLYDLPTYSDDYVPPPVTVPDDGFSDESSDSDDEGHPMIEDFDWAMKVLALKFIVLKIGEELVVFVIHHPIDSIAFARPGDKAWTEVVEPWPRNPPRRPFIHGAMVWDGKVVILYTHISQSNNAEIAYCAISTIASSSCSNPVKAKGGYISIPYDLYDKTCQQSIRDISMTGEMYMVELAGDLLVVFRERESGIANEYEDGNPVYLWENKHCYRTINFKVFKHVSSSSSWEKVEDLGDYMLFVGDNYASALHISKAPNCQKNAIYYIDDESRVYWGDNHGTKVRGHDMGVFDIASGNITSFHDGTNTISEYFAPIWFMPNF